jgi:hypothetical protein
MASDKQDQKRIFIPPPSNMTAFVIQDQVKLHGKCIVPFEYLVKEFAVPGTDKGWEQYLKEWCDSKKLNYKCDLLKREYTFTKQQ